MPKNWIRRSTYIIDHPTDDLVIEDTGDMICISRDNDRISIIIEYEEIESVWEVMCELRKNLGYGE